MSITLNGTTGITTPDVSVTAQSTAAITANRLSSDGTVINVQKDGTTVGSIGSSASDLMIGNGAVGLRFNDSTSQIYAYNTSTIANSDGLIDIGRTTARFKDLYLSGGVYVGGTGSANHLDDYEEGTWAPVLTDDSGNAFGMSGATVGTYTKIGNLVTVIAYCSTTGIGSASGDVRLTGLPFTVENSDARGAVTVGNASSMSLGTPGFSVTGLVVGGTTYIYFYIWNATSGTASRLSTTTHTTVAVMYMSCTYRV
jgi:hypothetical protein